MRSLEHVRAFTAVWVVGGGLLAGLAPALAYGNTGLAASVTPGSEPQATYTDPFAYCSAVGTIDVPDSHYRGPQVPEAVARGLKIAFGAPVDAPLDVFMSGTSWRCMGGKVYACNVGANLPCGEKANTSRTPGPDIVRWCKENPQADVVPAFVTGRATVYEWTCTDGMPTIVRQLAWPDAQGFLSHIWYVISPPR